MRELSDRIKYDLIQSFEYSENGEVKKATNLIIKMPTGRLAQYTAVIDQEFQKASAYLESNFPDLISSDNKSQKIQEVETESYEMISKALAAGNSNLNECYKALKSILTFKIGNFSFCMIDETTPFGSANFDSMSMKDINNVLGRFIESFL